MNTDGFKALRERRGRDNIRMARDYYMTLLL